MRKCATIIRVSEFYNVFYETHSEDAHWYDYK